MKKTFLLLFLLFNTACLERQLLETVANDHQKNLYELRVEIEDMASNMTACQDDNQCRRLHFSSNSNCPDTTGGLIVSENSTIQGTYENRMSSDFITLLARLQSWNERSEEENKDVEYRLAEDTPVCIMIARVEHPLICNQVTLQCEEDITE